MPRAHVHTAMASLVLLTSVAVPAGAAPRDATPRDLTPPAIGAPLAATPSELPATTRQPGETPGEPTKSRRDKGSKRQKQAPRSPGSQASKRGRTRKKTRIRSGAGATGKGGAARERQLLRQERRVDVRRGGTAPDATAPNIPAREPTWRDRRHLTGSWWGARTAGERQGFILEPGYAVEAGVGGRTKPRAGLTGLLDIVATWHDPWPGGHLTVIGQFAHGSNLSLPRAGGSGVGDVQGVSNIAGPTRAQLSGLWWHQEIGPAWIRVGRMDANIGFAALELAAELLQSSFGVPPNIPLPTWPDPGWGVVSGVKVGRALEFEAAVFEAQPRGGDPWRRPEGALLLFEATLNTLARAGSSRGGAVHAGVWGRGDQANPRLGAWLMAEEPVWADGDRFVALFGQLSMTGAGATIPMYGGGGIIAQGLWVRRPTDIVSVAFAHARLATVTPSTGWGSVGNKHETALEVLYKLSLAASLNLALDLQWVRNPNGATGTGKVAIVRLTTLL